MDVFSAIRNRCSDPRAKAESLPKELVMELLAYAACAPHHKKTAPWRFTVFMDDKRQILQDAWAAAVQREGGDLAKIDGKTERAPVIVAVWCAAGRGKPVPVWEEEAAVSAAIQNLLLAAEGKNMAGFWRSGSLGGYPEVHALMKTDADTFDATKGDRVMGFIYLGYCDKSQPVAEKATQSLEGRISFVA